MNLEHCMDQAVAISADNSTDKLSLSLSGQFWVKRSGIRRGLIGLISSQRYIFAQIIQLFTQTDRYSQSILLMAAGKEV